MRKLIFFVVALLGINHALQAQFPNMGLNGSVLYVSPLSRDFAVGASFIEEPTTRFLVNGGQVQVKSDDSGNLLQLNTINDEGTRVRQVRKGTEVLTDWSTLPSDSTYHHFFSFYRHGSPNGQQGIRLYRSNPSLAISTQLGAGGTDSYFMDGNIGFGTRTPSEKLHIRNGRLLLDQANGQGLLLDLNGNNDPSIRTLGNGTGLRLEASRFWLGNQYSSTIQVYADQQQVAIGGNNNAGVPSGYTLGVYGKIICPELTVQKVDNWPDYVFTAEYNLLSLEELDTFIAREGHLPGLPSAEEVLAAGQVDVGEMQRLLLEKIEELTRYTLELKTMNDELKTRVEELEQQ